MVLDTRLTPELIEEGFVREVISKIQSMRRDADFDVLDHINVTIKAGDKLMAIVEGHKDEISHDTLADSITAGEPAGEAVAEWDINGENAVIGVAVVK